MVQYIKAKKNGKYYVLRYYQHIDYPDEQKKIQEKQNLKAVLNKCTNMHAASP